MNRNDITLAVHPETGDMWIAQGNPALHKLPEGLDMEVGLYYSQIWHRCAALGPNGWIITTPGVANKGHFEWVRFPLRFGKATTTPCKVDNAVNALERQGIKIVS